MAIEKLSEFAKDGQKNTDDLVLTDGFSVSRKPARQWFNWLFNTLTLKINEIIEADYIRRNEIVDNLTTNDATKPVSAKQAKYLNDNKLGKTENAVSASKLETARIISFSGAATGSLTFNGAANSSAVLTLANSGVVANTYGSNLKIPVLTVNQKGLISGVSEQQIPIVDDLSTGGSTKLLSAEQGKVLSDLLDVLNYCPIAYPKSMPPSGYLAMMGQAISQATYPKLYALYGATLPDMRGMFIRGWDNGRGLDSGRMLLSYQADEIKSHDHYQAFGGFYAGRYQTVDGFASSNSEATNGSVSTKAVTTSTTGGTETRPKNIVFNFIVKAG